MSKATKKQNDRRMRRGKGDESSGASKHEYNGRPVDPGSSTRQRPQEVRQRWLDDQGNEHPTRKAARLASKNKMFAPRLVRHGLVR